MLARRTPLFVLFSLLFALAACGGSGGAEDSNDGAGNSDNTDPGGGDGSGGDADKPEIDAASMPPPGEAHVEVDGQTFVFKQSEMLEGPFTCEIRDDGITINFQSDGHDLLLQGASTPEGTIIASGTVAPDTGDYKYFTAGAGGRGALATDAPYVLYEGVFDSSPYDDPNPNNYIDVGIGTIAVTCP